MDTGACGACIWHELKTSLHTGCVGNVWTLYLLYFTVHTVGIDAVEAHSCVDTSSGIH